MAACDAAGEAEGVAADLAASVPLTASAWMRAARSGTERVRDRAVIAMLARQSLIGRIVDRGLRELVISFGRIGIRHQRELDYP